MLKFSLCIYTTELLPCITLAVRPFQEKMRFYLDSRAAVVGVGRTNGEKVWWPLQGPALPSWGECLERSAHASG